MAKLHDQDMGVDDLQRVSQELQEEVVSSCFKDPLCVVRILKHLRRLKEENLGDNVDVDTAAALSSANGVPHGSESFAPLDRTPSSSSNAFHINTQETILCVDEVKVRFGVDTSLLQQRVWHALASKDAIVAVPTRTSTSLCYLGFGTASKRKGCTIVVSASINMMKNKVQELKGLGFHVEFCGTVQRDLRPPASLVDVANGHAVLPEFLFLTPEYACSHSTELQAVQMDVILCAVDEVQELLGASTLRPKYANMPSVLRKVAGNRFPIILTSSTISRDDQDLLAHQFDMQDPFIFFKPIPCDVPIFIKAKQSIKQDLHHLLDKEGRTIIFCHKRGETDTIVDALNKDSPGIAMPYHATLKPFVGEATLAAFTTGNVKILATTTALGAIDDTCVVQRVIFYGVPPNLNTWVQFMGLCAHGVHGVDEHGAITVYYALGDFQVFGHYYSKCRSNVEQRCVEASCQTMYRLYSAQQHCLYQWLAAQYGQPLVDPCQMCSTCEDTHDKQDVTDIALAIFGRLPKGQKLILSDFVSLLRARTKRVPSWMTSCQVDDIALPLQMQQSLWEEDVCRIVNTML